MSSYRPSFILLQKKKENESILKENRFHIKLYYMNFRRVITMGKKYISAAHQ
jgi:hypothetical protein